MSFLFEMQIDSYAYLPPRFQHSLKCYASATLVVFERRYVPICVIIDWVVCHLVQMFHLHGMLGMRIHSKYPYMAMMPLKNLFFRLKLLCYWNIISNQQCLSNWMIHNTFNCQLSCLLLGMPLWIIVSLSKSSVQQKSSHSLKLQAK